MQIFGVVKNANTGELIPRATCTVKDYAGNVLQQFSVNDAGSFTLSVNGTERLYFTAVGFAPIDVPVAYYTNGQTINITMFPVLTSLPPVVVTAKKNNYLIWILVAAVAGKVAKLY